MQMIKQGTLFIAYSHDLDMATTGKSEVEALATYDLMMTISKNENLRGALLCARLLELGWTNRAKRWFPAGG